MPFVFRRPQREGQPGPGKEFSRFARFGLRLALTDARADSFRRMRLKIPSQNARIPFYAGVLTCVIPWLVGCVGNTLNIEDAKSSVVWLWFALTLLLSYLPLFLVPAFQLQSWRHMCAAVFCSPVLFLFVTLADTPFLVDSRCYSPLPSIVPGGENEMNPGDTLTGLLPEFAIFLAFAFLGLRMLYGPVRMAAPGLVWRAVTGGLVLLVILFGLIFLHFNEWGYYYGPFDSDHLFGRIEWGLGAVIWLMANGAYWMYVLGKREVEPKNAAMVNEPLPSVPNTA